MNKYKLNKNIFFICKDNKFIIWNYKIHEQYELDKHYLTSLFDFAVSNKNIENNQILNDLINFKILINYDEHEIEWKWDILSHIFHIGTCNSEINSNFINESIKDRSKQYVEYCESIKDEIPEKSFNYEIGNIKEVSLKNEKNKKEINLYEVLKLRSTTRSFTGESIDINDISTILSETFEYREHNHEKFAEKGLETFTKRRSSPSGGSLQCSEAYLIARNVNNLESGIYHYRSHKNNLGLIKRISKSFKFGSDYLLGQSFSDDADAFIIITSRLNKMWWKYAHSRAYRVACLDVGHLSQTASLIATGLNIRTWTTAAFYDEKIIELLNIPSNSAEFPFLVLGFGTGYPDPIDKYLELN